MVISQLIQNLLRYSSTILTTFTDSPDFFIFPCYKETNEVSI